MKEGKVRSAARGAMDARYVIIGTDVLSSVNDLFAESFGDAKAVAVTGENEFGMAGKEVQRLLEEAGRETGEPYVFPPAPRSWTPSTTTSSHCAWRRSSRGDLCEKKEVIGRRYHPVSRS